jgi:hypothetical protein
MSRKNLDVLCEENFLLTEPEIDEVGETDITDCCKNSVGGSTELHASCTVVGEPGQCGDSLCLEAVWKPPHASPFALATGHWCA